MVYLSLCISDAAADRMSWFNVIPIICVLDKSVLFIPLFLAIRSFCSYDDVMGIFRHVF